MSESDKLIKEHINKLKREQDMNESKQCECCKLNEKHIEQICRIFENLLKRLESIETYLMKR